MKRSAVSGPPYKPLSVDVQKTNRKIQKLTLEDDDGQEIVISCGKIQRVDETHYWLRSSEAFNIKVDRGLVQEEFVLIEGDHVQFKHHVTPPVRIQLICTHNHHHHCL